MAAQTLTDVTRNYDDAAISGLLNGELITLNNSNLIINSDVRWAQQAAVLGSITISTTLGGSVLVDGRDVWWIPFDASSGNVPALGTAGVQNCDGGTSLATGEFLGIWSALGTAPLASGSPIPSTGFIKFRSKVGNFLDNEIINLPGGANVTVNSITGGRRGWIHVVGAEAGAVTVPRLGTFQTRGDWFELGETNGSDDQTFQFPVTDNCPAIQIETAPGSGVYEWYLNAGSRWGTATVFVPTDARGKYFGQDNATGIITIARRVSNACGFKPASGCKVRIPNIIVSSSTNANWNLNTINATAATRYDFVTTSAGNIDIEGIIGTWFLSFASAFAVRVVNSALLQTLTISNTASTTTLDNVAVGLNAALELSPVTLSNLFSGGLIRDVRAARYASSGTGQFVFSVTDCEQLNFTRVIGELFGSTTAVTRGNATVYSFFFTRANNFTMESCVGICGRLDFSQCANVNSNNYLFAEGINGTTPNNVNPISAIVVSNASINIDINGFSSFANIANQHPYTGLLSITNAYFITFRNVGTASVPYNMGSANACGVIATLATATNLVFRRIYTQNTRTAPFSTANTVQGVVMDNVWGDGADSQQILALNVTPKGCRWTRSLTGGASVYGRHWEDAFISATAGFILIAMNEPLAATADQVEATAGTPAFTSGGQVAMRTLGDQVTWTCPYFVLGYTSLTNVAPTITGTNTANFSFEYQIDIGSGFSAWKTMNAANLSGETISPLVGFRLKVRATVTVANSANALTFISIAGTTNSTDQQIQYPLPFDAAASITGIIAGSRIQIYNVTTATELRNEIVPGTSFTFGYYNGIEASPGDVIRIRLAYVNGANARLPQEIIAVASSLGFSALASQVQDTVYNTNAIDGSTVTELTSDYPNLQIDSNDVDGETTVQRIYAWFVNNRASSQGIEQYFDALLAEDLVNYRIKASVVNLKIDNVIATPLKIIGGRIYRDDGDTVIAATSNSIQIDPDKAYGVEVGTSGLTVSESNTLNKLNALTEDVSGLRFTSKALEQAPAGGGGGSADWTAIEKNQIRHRLGIDGTAAIPSATPNLGVPSAAANASQVRIELAPELGRMDVNVSSRASQTSVDTKPNLAAIEGSSILAKEATVATRASQTSVNSIPTNPLLANDSRLNFLDAAISTRLASAGYTPPPSVSAIASQVRTELALELGRIDTSISTRLATAGYTSPPTAAIIADAVWDELLSGHAIVGSSGAALSGAGGGVSPSMIAAAVRLELAPELGMIDTEISSRLASAGYTVPPNASTIAGQVRAELGTELGRIDAPISTRSTPAQVNTEVSNALNSYDPPTKAELDSAIAGIPTVDYSAIASAVWTATTRSLNVDVTLGSSEITEIANAVQAAIINEGDGQQVIDAIVNAIGNENITAISIAQAVRTNLATELGRIDVSVSSRASQGSVFGLY